MNNNSDQNQEEALPLMTEDVGKIFEKAVCLAFNIPYNGHFKYEDILSQELAKRMETVPVHFSSKYTHTAKGGATYDFSPESKNGRNAPYISCKSNKSGQKVAPHSIGQAQPETFCQRLDIPFTDIPTLKAHLQKPTLISEKLLPELEKCTFDADILYYHQKDDTIQLIKQISGINWQDLDFSWTKSAADWNNSSTLKANKVSLLEVQFHQKNRTNMAVRWNFKNVLGMFPKCFRIITV